MLSRAYSVLTVKSIDEERRLIRGTATDPSPDRAGDIMEPLGASFAAEIPLLLHHRKETPVGSARLGPKTSAGIDFEAVLPVIDDLGPVKDEVDRAWTSVKHKLIRGASIGFRPLAGGMEPLKSGGLRFLKYEILELSLVTIPMNQRATIAVVKAFDLAASGLHPPGDSGTLPVVSAVKAAQTMTITEQITSFENKRAANVARMNDLMTKSAEAGSTLDAAQAEEYDTLEAEVKSVDVHLTRMRALEQQNLAAATRITTTPTEVEKAALLRGGETSTTPRVTVQSMLPKGTAFTRMCMALASSKGDSFQAIERAKSWRDTPEVELMVKSAVAVGTTTDSTWAGPLVVAQPLIDEFLELLRPRTLLGRIPGLKQVPFNVTVPTQTTGGTYGWVGQNKPKPVTKADYSTVTLTFSKAAGIIVLSEELVRMSSPSAENLVREEMIAGMGAFLDTQFVDPSVAASSGVNPASITNGAATIASSGVTGAAAKVDLASRVAVFTAANIPLEGSVWLMNDSNAFGLGLSLNALGQPLFPGFGQNGGTLLGIPVVISNNVGARIILMHAPSILYADEGGVRVDVSREASVQMDTAPTDTVDATTVYLSLWQRNLIGLKAERFITWVRARTAAVTYITTSSSYNGT